MYASSFVQFSALSLTLTTSASWAQDQSPKVGAGVQAKPTVIAAPAAEASADPMPAAAPVPVWKTALVHYELGEGDEALEILKKEVLRCAGTEGACDDAELGTLYACVGIVLAGGPKNHEGAVVAFRKALSLDPEIVLMPVYKTVEVDAAFEEAQTGRASVPPSATESGGAAQLNLPVPPSEEELEQRRQEASDRLKKRGFLLLSGNLGFGQVEVYNYDDGPGDDGYYYGSSRTIDEGLMRIGGAFTVAGMPGQSSGFTMGGRVRGGAYLTDGQTYGHFGAAGLLGATIGPRQDDRFTYFLGGFGFDYVPGAVSNSIAAALSFQGGVSLGGLQLGGTVDLEGGENFFALMMGMEIGFGKLL